MATTRQHSSSTGQLRTGTIIKSTPTRNNKRTCNSCHLEFHRNSVKRHQLICSHNNNSNNRHKRPGGSQESKWNKGSPKRIRLEDKEEEEAAENMRSKLRSASSTTTTIVKKEEVKKEEMKNQKEKMDNVKRSQGLVANTNPKIMIKREKNDDDLVCLLCKKLIIKGNLESHYKSSHKLYNSKIFKCEICRKTFDKSIHWCHYKEHHTIEKVHRCSECNLVFSYVQNLLYHKSVDHLKEMYKSKYCQRKDKDKEPNNGHVNSDHGSVSSGTGSSSSNNSNSSNSPRLSIDSSSSFEDHSSHRTTRLRSIETMRDQLKTCPVDGTNFNCTVDLLDHIRLSHHWPRENQLDPVYEPDLWCPECGLDFVVKPTLVKHLKISHEDSLSTINVKSYMERVGYGVRPLLPHQCQVCYNVIDSQNSFNIHRRTHGLAFLSFLKSSML